MPHYKAVNFPEQSDRKLHVHLQNPKWTGKKGTTLTFFSKDPASEVNEHLQDYQDGEWNGDPKNPELFCQEDPFDE